MENVLREIGFDSKLISEIYRKEETYLKMALAVESHTTKGGTRRSRGAIQQVRKVNFFVKSVFLFKPISANISWAKLSCRNDGSRRSSGGVRGEIEMKRVNIFTKRSFREISWLKIDFWNLFWADARMQAIKDEPRECEGSNFGWKRFFFFLVF